MVMIFWKFPKGPEWNQILLMFKVLFRFYLKLFTFKSRVWRRFSSWSPNTTFFRVFFAHKTLLEALMVMIFWKFPKSLEWNQKLLISKVLLLVYWKLFTYKSLVLGRCSISPQNTTFFRGFLHIKHHWRLWWLWSFGNFPIYLNETKYY